MQLKAILCKSKTIAPGEYFYLEQKPIMVFDDKGHDITKGFKLYDKYSFTEHSESQLSKFCEKYSGSDVSHFIVRLFQNAIYIHTPEQYKIVLVLDRKDLA